MKKQFLLIAFSILLISGCSQTIDYLTCPRQGTISQTVAYPAQNFAVSQLTHSRLAARLRYEPKIGHMVEINIVLTDSQQGNQELSPTRIHLYDEDYEAQKRIQPDVWSQKIRSEKKWNLLTHKPLLSQNLPPGEEYEGTVVFHENIPSAWMLLTMDFAGDEHVLVFRKDKDEDCLPQKLPMDLYNKLIKMKTERK